MSTNEAIAYFMPALCAVGVFLYGWANEDDTFGMLIMSATSLILAGVMRLVGSPIPGMPKVLVIGAFVLAAGCLSRRLLLLRSRVS